MDVSPCIWLESVIRGEGEVILAKLKYGMCIAHCNITDCAKQNVFLGRALDNPNYAVGSNGTGMD